MGMFRLIIFSAKNFANVNGFVHGPKIEASLFPPTVISEEQQNNFENLQNCWKSLKAESH